MCRNTVNYLNKLMLEGWDALRGFVRSRATAETWIRKGFGHFGLGEGLSAIGLFEGGQMLGEHITSDRRDLLLGGIS